MTARSRCRAFYLGRLGLPSERGPPGVSGPEDAVPSGDSGPWIGNSSEFSLLDHASN